MSSLRSRLTTRRARVAPVRPAVRRAARAAVAALALALHAPHASAQRALDPLVDSLRLQIEAAVERADVARLAAARGRVERALADHPDDGLLLHYQGYALWREGTFVGEAGDVKRARELLEAADAVLGRSAERLPLAETHAVRASALGQRIGLGANPVAVVRLGRRAGAELERAAALGPQNPRVALVQGIAALNAPRLLGGSPERAARHLARAIALFATDRPAPALPAWGHAEAHAHLGQLHARAGRANEARLAYRQALALEPGNRWVREALLPAVEERAEGGSR